MGLIKDYLEKILNKRIKRINSNNRKNIKGRRTQRIFIGRKKPGTKIFRYIRQNY